MMYNSIETNLAGDCFYKLESGIWKLGLIEQNDGITDKNSTFYKKESSDNSEKNTEVTKFKNKVFVKLIDGERIYAHIIHWHPTDGYFCITTDEFWDQFDD